MSIKNKLKQALQAAASAVKERITLRNGARLLGMAALAAGVIHIAENYTLDLPIIPVEEGVIIVPKVVRPQTLEDEVNNTKVPTSKFTIPANRVVILSGEVNERSREIARKIAKLAEESSDMIYLLINSPGGSVFDGVQIIQAIEASRAPVTTVCTQICASMAAMIFEYGSTRLMSNKSVLMFHPASGGVQGEVDKMVSKLLFIQAFIGKVEAQIAKRASISFTEYKYLSGHELWLDGDQAISRRFADAVVSIEGSKVFDESLSFKNSSLRRNSESTERTGNVCPMPSVVPDISNEVR